MKNSFSRRERGFTLLETVIAIGVLTVLLTGFMVVFAPAADGIRKSMNVQQADRLVSTLEREMATKRDASAATGTGFEKAFQWILNSNNSGNAVLVYQYRARNTDTGRLRTDGTPVPVADMSGQVPGGNYIVVPMARLKNDPLVDDDLEAVEGPVFLVKCTQLVFDSASGALKAGAIGKIKDPKGSVAGDFTNSNDYPEAVIAFTADFYQLPSSKWGYINSTKFTDRFSTVKNPVFTRNLAVRR